MAKFYHLCSLCYLAQNLPGNSISLKLNLCVTNVPMDGHTLLQRCEDACKNPIPFLDFLPFPPVQSLVAVRHFRAFGRHPRVESSSDQGIRLPPRQEQLPLRQRLRAETHFLLRHRLLPTPRHGSSGTRVRLRRHSRFARSRA